MKIINKDEVKTITFGTTGCLVLLAMLGLCLGVMAGVAMVAVYRFIAG